MYDSPEELLKEIVLKEGMRSVSDVLRRIRFRQESLNRFQVRIVKAHCILQTMTRTDSYHEGSMAIAKDLLAVKVEPGDLLLIAATAE